MKKIFLLTALAVLLGMASATAQQISVVTESGETTIYQTFQAAIEGASDGSVIYLPGGGFIISDDLKITKRLTIIGIGHKSNNDNVDGTTTISGNLWFNEGSSGSGVMGCYITGNVNIGEGDATVNNVMVKCCNLNSVNVLNNTCLSTFVNQNYIRSNSNFNGAPGSITNNIMHSVKFVTGGTISHNIFLGQGNYIPSAQSQRPYYACVRADYSYINNNIMTPYIYSVDAYYVSQCAQYRLCEGSYNNVINNITKKDNIGEECINLNDIDWNDYFKNYNGGSISTNSNFHTKDTYVQYENTHGVYGGTGFNDKQIAPVPYISAKHIDQETDASGKLSIRIRVKAGE